MSEISVFDEQLAEIDRRLRTIQSDLAPLPDPAPESPAPASPPRLRAAPDLAPPPDPTATLIAQLHELRDANERLLELHRELLAQYAELLQRHAADAADAATLTAGPFASVTALRAFEHALSTLPGVTDVAVREYLAADRVAIDVRLSSR